VGGPPGSRDVELQLHERRHASPACIAQVLWPSSARCSECDSRYSFLSRDPGFEHVPGVVMLRLVSAEAERFEFEFIAASSYAYPVQGGQNQTDKQFEARTLTPICMLMILLMDTMGVGWSFCSKSLSGAQTADLVAVPAGRENRMRNQKAKSPPLQAERQKKGKNPNSKLATKLE
jgi:hypothetical protein